MKKPSKSFKRTNLSLAERFWIRVRLGSAKECWPWLGAANAWGYGYISIGGILYRAHRVAYCLTKGEIPDGALILHSCDNRLCCNPAHLWKGTQSENVKHEWDRYRKPAQSLGLLIVRTRKNRHA